MQVIEIHPRRWIQLSYGLLPLITALMVDQKRFFLHGEVKKYLYLAGKGLVRGTRNSAYEQNIDSTALDTCSYLR